jgi:hypothetical protein
MLNKQSAPFFYLGMLIFGLAIGLPFGWGFLHFHASSEPPIYQEQAAAQPDDRSCRVPPKPEPFLDRAINDPIAVISFLLVVITFFLAAFTYGLFAATADLATDSQRTAARVRSIVRGGGWLQPDGIFNISGSNSGTGAAILEAISWGFCEFGELPTIPVYEVVRTVDSLAPNMRSVPAKFVFVPTFLIRPVIFFRFDYFDVAHRRRAYIGHVMELRPPGMPPAPVQIPADPIYLIDTFPIEADPSG